MNAISKVRGRIASIDANTAAAYDFGHMPICDAAGVWKLDGTLKYLAEQIGLTHEALYRALATLERTERIRPDRR